MFEKLSWPAVILPLNNLSSLSSTITASLSSANILMKISWVVKNMLKSVAFSSLESVYVVCRVYLPGMISRLYVPNSSKSDSFTLYV